MEAGAFGHVRASAVRHALREAHNAEWDAILTCLAEAIAGTPDAARRPGPPGTAEENPCRTDHDLTAMQRAQRMSLLAMARDTLSPLPASRLASFIHPMGYYKFLFDRKQELTKDLEAMVRAYYAQNEIRRWRRRAGKIYG